MSKYLLVEFGRVAASVARRLVVVDPCIANRAARTRLPTDLPVPRNREMLAATLTTFGATVIREVSHPAVMAMFRLAISEAERSPDVAEILSTSRSANRNALAGVLA